MKRAICIFVVVMVCAASLSAQTRVLGVIGSSTAAGTGASVPDSSWVARLDYYYRVTRNVISATHNLAVPGTTPYNGMPDGYVPPAGRPAPDTEHNITELMSLNPDVILVSYASNGYNTYSFAEIKSTLETIRNVGVNAGKRVYITSSQPRTSFGTAARAKLRDVKDSIMKWFGEYAINFFDSIVDPTDLSIAPQYRYSGDDIHLNDAGHAVLYRQVLARDIFAIALAGGVKDFKASTAPQSKVVLQWSASDSDSQLKYVVERSSDGRNFIPIATIQARPGGGTKNYRHEDRLTSAGRYYYRLKLQSPGSVNYSVVLSVVSSESGTPIVITGNPVRHTLRFDLYADEKQSATVIIYNAIGERLYEKQITVNAGRNQLSIPFDRNANGRYQLHVQLKDKLVRSAFINASR